MTSRLPLWAREMAPVGGPRPKLTTLIMVMLIGLLAIYGMVLPAFRAQLVDPTQPRVGPACAELARLRSHDTQRSSPSLQRAVTACRREQTRPSTEPASIR